MYDHRTFAFGVNCAFESNSGGDAAASIFKADGKSFVGRPPSSPVLGTV